MLGRGVGEVGEGVVGGIGGDGVVGVGAEAGAGWGGGCGRAGAAGCAGRGFSDAAGACGVEIEVADAGGRTGVMGVSGEKGMVFDCRRFRR